MIENQYNQPLPNTWIINDVSKDKENRRIIRKFINSAIYVEKAVSDMPPSRKTSSLSIIEDFDESEVENITTQCYNDVKPVCKTTSQSIVSKTAKSCDITKNIVSSATYPGNHNDESKTCNWQEKTFFSDNRHISQITPESGYITNNQSSHHSFNSERSLKTQVTVQPRDLKLNNCSNSELRLSLSYLNTNRTERTSTLDPKEKQEIVQGWLAKKQSEQKRKALQEAQLVKQKEEERQILIEKERETFKKWLADKKKEEDRKKIQKELEEQELKLRDAEKEKRKVENEISFNLWLRRKKKYDLERRIREKIALLHMYEQKQNRLEENEKAYQEWLKNAKTRPKPIPMNRGLQSLCSSASVTYINPVPWSPNIDPIPKPSSQ